MSKKGCAIDASTIGELAQIFLRELPVNVSSSLADSSMGIGAPQLFIGVIGNIGSGKTTVSTLLESQIPGSVHVQANSARYLLKKASHPWGSNVDAILDAVVVELMTRGYSVILDGGVLKPDRRSRYREVCEVTDVPYHFIRLHADTTTCIARTADRYQDDAWVSSFSDFRVNSTDKMIQNVRDLALKLRLLPDFMIRGPVRAIHNESYTTLGELEREVKDIGWSLMSANQ